MRYALAGLGLVLASTLAWAEEPSYSYIQASYVDIDIDTDFGDADGDGVVAGASIPINDQWHVFAGYGSSDFDGGIDIDEFSIGGGWHTGISDRTDFVATVAYVSVDASAGGPSFDDDGIGLSVGLRSMVRDNLEVYGAISYVDLDAAGDGTSIGAGLWYTVSGNFAVGLGVDVDDDVTGIGAGIRLYFDR